MIFQFVLGGKLSFFRPFALFAFVAHHSRLPHGKVDFWKHDLIILIGHCFFTAPSGLPGS